MSLSSGSVTSVADASNVTSKGDSPEVSGIA